jgi:hypothetical protein
MKIREFRLALLYEPNLNSVVVAGAERGKAMGEEGQNSDLI